MRIPVRIGYLHVFFFALVLRVIYLWQAFANNELIDYPVVDASVYVGWAQRIAAGQFLWYTPVNYTPAYPFYLSFWMTLFGSDFKIIFLMFHVLGALQAVVIGKTAELLRNRNTGLVAGFLAAAYWPAIVMESTFYCENMALWTLSVGMLFLVVWTRKNRPVWLVGAGLFLGMSALARANMLLCLIAMAVWVAVRIIQGREPSAIGARIRRSVVAAVLLLLPVLILSAPIAWWNNHILDVPVLRTQAGMCLYMGNNPDFDGLIPSPGLEYINMTKLSLYENQGATVRDSERFWTSRAISVVRERPGEWLRLQGRKLLMLFGSYEISQEIAMYRFRDASSVLKLPFWPGFGFLAVTAAGGLWLAIRGRSRSFLPHILFAAVYFASVFPFQIASRFRLPVIVVLLPLSAYLLVRVVELIRDRRWRPVALAAVVLAVAAIIALPDHTGLAERNAPKHWYYIGVKREGINQDRALEAYASAAAERRGDPDPHIRMGHIRFGRGQIEQARADFRESMKRLDRNPEALLGLARCALKDGNCEEAMVLAVGALEIWPNDPQALNVLASAYIKDGDWARARETVEMLRSFRNHSVDVDFLQVTLNEQLGDVPVAISVCDRIEMTDRYDPFARDRAAYTAGVLVWRRFGDVARAREKWQRVGTHGADTFFGPLAGHLLGRLAREDMLRSFTGLVSETGSGYIEYTIGLAAWINGSPAEARETFAGIASTNAVQDTGESIGVVRRWAEADLEKIR